MLFRTRCELFGRWTSTPSPRLGRREVWLSGSRAGDGAGPCLRLRHGFESGACNKWRGHWAGYPLQGGICASLRSLLNGSALSKTMDKNGQKVCLTKLSTGAFSRSVARLTDGIRKKKNKYPEMEELLGRDFQCPGSGTVIVRGISA